MFFRFAPMGKVEKTRLERNWTTFVNAAFSAAWKSAPKMVAWNWNCKIWSNGCFFCLAKMGKVEKTRFERNWTTFVNPAFSAAWKSPHKMVAWNRNCKIWSHGCFFCLAKVGKVEKTRFERNWTTFVNPAFSAAWKSPPKMVAWNRSCKIRSLACSPNRNCTNLNPKLDRNCKIDPKGFFSFLPDRESLKNVFCTQLDDLRQPGFFR